jgi:hypothetical protein
VTRADLRAFTRRHPQRILVVESDAIYVYIDAWCDGNEAEAKRLERDLARLEGRKPS